MDTRYRQPFRIAPLLALILSLSPACSPRGGPGPAGAGRPLDAESMAQAGVIFERARESFDAGRWSVAANGLDRLLDRFFDSPYTPDALRMATAADLRRDEAVRASDRLLGFRKWFHEGYAADGPGREGLLTDVVRLFSDAGRPADGLGLLLDLVPEDLRPDRPGGRVYDTAVYLAFQLPADEIEGWLAARPSHVLIPALRIHLAERALQDGDPERALDLVSGVPDRSLREAEQTAAREIRRRASGGAQVDGKVALLLPFSGSYSRYARAVLEGVQLALHPPPGEAPPGLGIEVFDTAGDLTTLMETLDRIDGDREILGVIGPLSSSLTIAASLRLRGKRLTLISPTASERGLHELGGNIYGLNFVDEALARRIAEFAVEDLGLREFAAIFPMDDYGYRMVRAFIARVEDLGGRVLVSQGYPISATTFDVELKRIRYYAPEAIFIPAHSEEIPMIAPQIPFYGMEDVQLLGTNGWNNRRVARLGGKYVEGAFFTDTFFESSRRIGYMEFSRRFEEIYQREASRVAGLGYDAMNLLLWGLNASGRRSREVDFTDLRAYRGTTAVYSMNGAGYFEKEPLLLTISGGKIRSVEESPTPVPEEEDAPSSTPVGPREEFE